MKNYSFDEKMYVNINIQKQNKTVNIMTMFLNLFWYYNL